jgi:hypothetical protein
MTSSFFCEVAQSAGIARILKIQLLKAVACARIRHAFCVPQCIFRASRQPGRIAPLGPTWNPTVPVVEPSLTSAPQRPHDSPVRTRKESKMMRQLIYLSTLLIALAVTPAVVGTSARKGL